MLMKKTTRKCREKQAGCEIQYEIWNWNLQCQAVCQNPKCLLSKAAKNKEKVEARESKKERVVTREKKQQLKTRPKLLQEAQAEFNRYVRLRDKEKPCICCGRPLPDMIYGGSYDCGHYRSVGSAPHMRFIENNAHAQTKKCNRFLSGNATDYRIGLIKRIGIEKVEALECDNEVRKYSREDLLEIKKHYRDMANILKRERE